MSTGLSGNTLYYYRVRAYNVTGNSGYSGTSTVTTPVTTIPSAASGLGVTVASATSLKLDWTDNANNETGVRIERSLNGTTWSQITTVGVNVTTYTNTGLTTGTRY